MTIDTCDVKTWLRNLRANELTISRSVSIWLEQDLDRKRWWQETPPPMSVLEQLFGKKYDDPPPDNSPLKMTEAEMRALTDGTHDN